MLPVNSRSHPTRPGLLRSRSWSVTRHTHHPWLPARATSIVGTFALYVRVTGNRDVGRVGRWRGSVHAHRRSGVMPSHRRHSARLAGHICAISSHSDHHPARQPSPSACRRQSHCREGVDLCRVTEALSRSLRLNSNNRAMCMSVAIESQAEAVRSAEMAEPCGMRSSYGRARR